MDPFDQHGLKMTLRLAIAAEQGIIDDLGRPALSPFTTIGDWIAKPDEANAANELRRLATRCGAAMKADNRRPSHRRHVIKTGCDLP